jgi:pimeloyl-ACP methyl ester carboxylesterase
MQGPHFVESTDGVVVAVHELGGDGPLVVACHATGFCGGVWEPFAARLAERYRVIALDFRGHGATHTPDHVELHWSGMADDLLAVIDAFGGGSPVRAVGHSMGGASIVLAESRRPGTFGPVWAFEPILFPRAMFELRDDPPDIAMSARRRRADFADRDEAKARWASKPPLSLLDPRALDAYARHGLVDRPDGGVTLACRPDREAEVFEHHDSGAFDELARVQFPFAVAVSGDGMPPAQLAEKAAATYPWIRLERYDHLTHFGPLEAPEELAAAAVSWLG